MKTALDLLAVCRAAKRELAMTKLANARRALEQAQAMQQQAQAAVSQAQNWCTELLTRCELGEHNVLRLSALPASRVLLEVQQQALAQHNAIVRNANTRVIAERQAIQQHERAVMRMDEWKALKQIQKRRVQAALEDREADDLVHRAN